MSGLEQHLPALQVVVPMLVAPLVILLKPRGLAWAACTAGSVLAFAIAIELTRMVLASGPISYAMGSWPAPYGIELRVDTLSALLLLVVTGASALTLAASRQSLDASIEAERQPLFFAAWLLALAGLAGIVVAGDAFNIFVFMEISSLASYVLIAQLRRIALTDTELAQAQAGTIRLKLFKVAARVVISVRRVVLHLCSHYPYTPLFHRIVAHLVPT